MTKCFKKLKKIGGILDPFSPNLAIMIFPRKKGFVSFNVRKYFNCLPLCKKSEKTNEPFLRKMPN